MITSLEGRVAVITGAGRGIGKAIAVALAAQGATVALVSRSTGPLHQVEDQIHGQGGNARSYSADVSQLDLLDRLTNQIIRDLGHPSILVNAAGIFGPIQLIRESDHRMWIDTVNVNTLAPYVLCRAFLSAMIDARWGRIINVSSAAALHKPGHLNSAYGTSKAALNHFTRHLAAEVEGTGVTANVIHPGEVKTEMWSYIRDAIARTGLEGEGYRQWARWVEETGGDPPEKAADLVLKLVSDDAASINGRFLWIEDGLQTPVHSW